MKNKREISALESLLYQSKHSHANDKEFHISQARERLSKERSSFKKDDRGHNMSILCSDQISKLHHALAGPEFKEVQEVD